MHDHNGDETTAITITKNKKTIIKLYGKIIVTWM